MVSRRGNRATVGAGTARVGGSGELCHAVSLFSTNPVLAPALAVNASHMAARSYAVIGPANAWRVKTSSVPSNWLVSPYSRETAGMRRANELAKGRPPRGRLRALRQFSISRRQACPTVSAVNLNDAPGEKRGNTINPRSITLGVIGTLLSSLRRCPNDNSCCTIGASPGRSNACGFRATFKFTGRPRAPSNTTSPVPFGTIDVVTISSVQKLKPRARYQRDNHVFPAPVLPGSRMSPFR